MRLDLADKELLESKQDIYEGEAREKSKLISEQAAVSDPCKTQGPEASILRHVFFF